MSADPVAVSPRCLHCGGPEIRSLDHVLTTCDVIEWALAAGALVPRYAESGSTVHWDGQEPADRARPWECSGCGARLSNADLLATVPDGPASAIDAAVVNRLALAEGWAIFNGDEIQADDEAGTFDSDDAAIAHVRLLARAGSSLHRKALQLCGDGGAPC